MRERAGSRTRRDFLKTTAAATASLAACRASSLWAASSAAASSAGVKGWTTSKDRKYAVIDAPQWRPAQAGSAPGIQIDSSSRYQKILGFGAAFTDASCYWFAKLNPKERQALLAEFFGPAGLRLSVCRTCMGASDYSLNSYSYDDSTEPDPDLRKFTIEHDRAYILPALRSAREINPELFLFSTPWSPPGWMKSGGSMLGGSMRKQYFATYADYFVRFLQGYSAEGVKVNAVTIQNEVDTDQNGRMPATLWGQEYEIEFVGKFLGPAFEKASLDTKIWILDHNYALWGRVLDEFSDPLVSKYAEGVAWHAYYGTVDAMTRVHDAFPAKSAYWTEGGPDYTSPDYLTDWVKWSHTFSDALRNWARCLVGWNLVLDEKGSPNIGPFPCGGVVTVDSKTHEITRSGQYWAFAHFSKSIRRGAQVLASAGDLHGIDHVAFENPDGSHVLVVTNQGDGQVIACQIGDQALNLALDSDSVTTLVW